MRALIASRAAPTRASPVAHKFIFLLAVCLAAVVPALLAYNQPPSSTLINQCLAAGLWGGVVLALQPARLSLRGGALQAALALVMLSAWGSWYFGGLPASLTLSSLGMLLCAMALAWAGIEAARQQGAVHSFAAFCAGLAAAGVLSALVALVQVFAPQWADGNLIAHSGLVGRAVGNLRQPNHLCSLLLWAVIAVVALRELGWLSLRLAAPAVVLLVFAVELSASRTGAAGLLLLLLWGVFDKRLSPGTRWLLVATPLIYAVSYGAMLGWGAIQHQAVGAEARLATAGGIESPNARPRIWANAVALIRAQPWTGVGYGEFNFAWSLTEFPGRPTAFFDHTHTLPLQLAVELGLPLAAAVMALLGVALWQAWRRSRRASGDVARAGAAAAVMVAMIGLHSLVEYPLWYGYFLLPAAFAWGFALGVPARDPLPDRRGPAGWAVGGVIVLGSALALVDYLRIVEIFAPGEHSAPLPERIVRGQRSPLFGYHADYAAATVADPQPGRDLAFRRAPHYLLDTRLMIAWAKYLEQRGEVDKARALAARLREFANPDADEFFAPCKSGHSREFQCFGPQAPHPWREFITR